MQKDNLTAPEDGGNKGIRSKDESLEKFLNDGLKTTDQNYFKDILSTDELATATGKTIRRIQQLAPNLIKRGLAARIGKPIICHKSAIKYIKTLPETRGRKKQ